jgi:hypothetical protein
MDLLLLGGNGPHNQPWLNDVEQTLKPLAGQCMRHEYVHWKNGGSIDIDSELVGVADKSKQLGEYGLFAKSIGIAIAAKGIGQNQLKPTTCIFVGLPLGTVQREFPEFINWLKPSKVPIVFVQNSEDPVGSAEGVRNFIASSGLNNYSFIQLPGNTHDYTNLDELKNIVGDALKRTGEQNGIIQPNNQEEG